MMTDSEEAALELECARGGLKALLAYERRCIEDLARAEKGIQEARERLRKASLAVANSEYDHLFCENSGNYLEYESEWIDQKNEERRKNKTSAQTD